LFVSLSSRIKKEPLNGGELRQGRAMGKKDVFFRSLPRGQDTFVLMQKYPKHQERTMLPLTRQRLARRSFWPTLFGQWQ